jgi:hypothetical protein
LDNNLFRTPEASDVRRQNVKRTLIFVAVLALCAAVGFGKDEDIEFYGYVDSDICSRVYLGPIDEKRVECTKQMHSDGDSLVLLRFRDNTAFEPRKQKDVKDHVGKAVKATGRANIGRGRIKDTTLEEVAPADVPSIEMGMWYGREKVDEDLWEKVRHELAMMPYISHYDFISFAMTGNDVILTGWTVRDTNRSGAFNRVKRIEGVGNVTNNIFVLPLGSFDNDIRARAMAAVQRQVPRYFWSSGSTVRIVVRNSQIILLGQVATEGDKTRAFMAARGVPNAFHVFNLLQVVPGT